MSGEGASTVFITGTDTGSGKTLIGCALLEAAARMGLSTAAVKPVAAGGDQTAQGLRNDDALALQSRCSPPLAYGQVNPLCLRRPIAPHIAAAGEQRLIRASDLVAACREVIALEAGFTVVEGAGGWQVPLNDREFFSDVVQALAIPVVLVVGMRLGCLNHALLSVRAMRQDKVELKGWVANRLDNGMEAYEENLAALRELMPAPMLAEVPFLQDASPSGAAACLDLKDFR